MENLNLKESNQTKDDTNQLESPQTDKYDSAESQQSDQSDLDQVDNSNFIKLDNESKTKQSTDLNSKMVNLSINDNHLNKSTNNEKLNGVHKNEQIKLNQPRIKSNNEILVAHTKERITNKFDLLEKETGLKLKKSGFNSQNSNKENNQDRIKDYDNLSLKANTNRSDSPDEVDYANSIHDSESVSSFEVKHQTLTADQIKEQAALRLGVELERTQKELKLKDEEIAKLSRIRREVELELEDLTASLFEEANKMVSEAKHAKSKSDKLLKECTLKNEVLQAEVKALKILVRSSIPQNTSSASTNRQGSFKSSRSSSQQQQPSANSHLDLIKNQLTPKLIKSPKTSLRSFIIRTSSGIPFHSKTSKTNVSKLLKSEKRSGYKKSPSNFELASTSIGINDTQSLGEPSSTLEKVQEETTQCINDLKKVGEIDPIYYEEFLEWKKCPCLDQKGSFMNRLYVEEIYPVMNFKNQKLTNQVLDAIKENNIIIELNTDKNNFQKKCALLDMPRLCNYRIKLNDEWYNICQLVRDRTSAVCDLFCYLRYIQQGLVKSGLTEVYWEIIRRRRNLSLSKLGFSVL